ncbi:MAG: ribosomal protein S18-alanine N-acetyltransferase [Actinomycetaceae bacterium]
MTARIRPLRRGDLDRVAALEPELFGPDDWPRSVYVSELTAPARRYYAAVDGTDRLIGWAGIVDADEAQVMTIGVDPAHRRQGIATALMAVLIDGAREAGANSVLLEVRADDPGALALYEGIGFHRIGLRRRYYQRSGADALVLRLDLRTDVDATDDRPGSR